MTNASKTEITVVSWNMLDRNKHLDRAFDFIQSLEADMICMQEVPAIFLEKLKSHFPYVSAARDRSHLVHIWSRSKSVTTEYNVLVSKYPITEQRTYEAVSAAKWSFRQWVFQLAVHVALKWSGGPEYDREVLSCSVDVQGKTIGVTVTHLLLENPTTRTNEFKTIAKRLPTDIPNIICGDFNIIESWYVKPINFFRAGTIASAMPWANERKSIEKLFATANLQNPLRGLITHRVSRSQLDHILVPEGAEVLSREVIKNAHGSDHNPVRVTLSLHS
jgi:endonuclease/exonuclease/phosphatase family metal-dependent hydrolase